MENKKIFEVTDEDHNIKKYAGTPDEFCDFLKELLKTEEVIWIHISKQDPMEIKIDDPDNDPTGIPALF